MRNLIGYFCNITLVGLDVSVRCYTSKDDGHFRGPGTEYCGAGNLIFLGMSSEIGG